MLDKYNFKSIFKNEFNNFVLYKRSLGLKYENEISRLKYIDDILFDLKLKNKIITKDIFIVLTKRNKMQECNYARQFGVTKDFCKFLIANDFKDIYYEEKKFHIVNNYKPVIFSDNEIILLFKIMDELKYTQKSKKYYNLYYTYSIFFRLIYACGLRVSEGIKIKIENINFSDNTIKIIDSKKHISRLVVFSESLKLCLDDYIKEIKIKTGLLFKNSRNTELCKNQLRKYYRKIIRISGLNENSHIHDLRHCFCNKAFNQMLENGYDENVVIVYLYKYMGHKTISETEYYLHLTDYNKQKIISNNDLLSKKLYEGVDLDNE